MVVLLDLIWNIFFVVVGFGDEDVLVGGNDDSSLGNDDVDDDDDDIMKLSMPS